MERYEVSVWVCPSDEDGLIPERAYEETVAVFGNIVKARRFAKRYVQDGRAEFGEARIYTRVRNDYGQWVPATDDDEAELVTVARRPKRV